MIFTERCGKCQKLWDDCRCMYEKPLSSDAVLADVRAILEKRHDEEQDKIQKADNDEVKIFRSGLEQGMALALSLIDNYLYHKS